MKERILTLRARIDALSLRERALVCLAACALLAFLGHALVLAPMEAAQEALRAQIAQQRSGMAAIDEAITGRVQAFQHDPDAQARTRLNALRQEMGQLGDQLLAIEHGLVPPERMGPLIDGILRANGRLKLVSMRTLPVEPLAGPGTPAPAPAPAAAPLLYRHGIEVTVRGNYLDMVDYMSALDAMPTRMFWGRAQLDVEEYPAARLTLTLHTLSLDRQWMKL
ncbi:MSHA biogenesis protein MshJ [Massilia sp. UYP32]|uniref:type II secretion system protein GspM n=1 Tax=Massilia TaxID=149698 RepID=UPI000D922B7C|nr:MULTISPECIES: type II secretion system protein GspM [Massilia]QYG02437.1 type II secretion system protein M [Massilia sp. NP310]